MSAARQPERRRRLFGRRRSATSQVASSVGPVYDRAVINSAASRAHTTPSVGTPQLPTAELELPRVRTEPKTAAELDDTWPQHSE